MSRRHPKPKQLASVETKQLTWQDVWTLPLKFDGYCYAWDTDNNMVLMFGCERSGSKIIVDVINGVEEFKVDKLTNERDEFFVNGEYVFSIRGWGHLTSKGGMNLSSEKAAEIQDEFAKYIMEKLTKV